MLKYQPKLKSLSHALSADKIPGRSRELSVLIKQAQQLQTLDDAFNESIPDFYRQKFHANSIRNRVLIVTCRSASLATRLTIDKKSIIKNLNLKLGNSPVSDIKVRIRPGAFERKSAKAERTLSTKNAQMLLEEAEQTEDKKLREALVRLAQHSD